MLPGYKNLPMTSFVKYVNGTDPDGAVDADNYMQGLDRFGNPYIYDGQELRYMALGDPLTGTGDLDYAPSDRRMMASWGPLNMNPGDSQYVLIKMAVAYSSEGAHPVQTLNQYLQSPIPQGPPVLKTEFTPDPVYAFMKFALEPIPAVISLGYDETSSLGNSINTSSIIINTDLPVDSVIVSPAASGFIGPVARIYCPIKELIESYGQTFGTETKTYTITGQYNDGQPFSMEGSFVLRSHRPGDFNLDNTLDIADLVAWVGYMFNEGAPPAELLVLDMDNDQQVDIADLVAFVHFMFD